MTDTDHGELAALQDQLRDAVAERDALRERLERAGWLRNLDLELLDIRAADLRRLVGQFLRVRDGARVACARLRAERDAACEDFSTASDRADALFAECERLRERLTAIGMWARQEVYADCLDCLNELRALLAEPPGGT